jgi:hypothetical protein
LQQPQLVYTTLFNHGMGVGSGADRACRRRRASTTFHGHTQHPNGWHGKVGRKGRSADSGQIAVHCFSYKA